MQLDQNPFFRKPITPWYDSTFACGILIGAMLIVFCFALGGIFVAGKKSGFSPHLWFPGMRAGLAGFLVVKVYFRLRARAKND